MKFYHILLFLIFPIIFFGCTTPSDNIKPPDEFIPVKNNSIENNTIQNDTKNDTSICDCSANEICTNNTCVLKQGCAYNNPSCNSEQDCIANKCVLKKECNSNSDCPANYMCKNNNCVKYCSKNSNCPSDEICQNGECSKPECKENSDCSSLTDHCVNYECEKTSKCLYDLNCNSGQVCIDQQCHNIVNCTKGECEDDYFRLDYVDYEDRKTERSISATIYPKTSLKGTFRIVWNEPEAFGYFKSVGKSFDSDDEYLRFLIIKYPEFQQTEHYIIEHVEEPRLLYLVWQSPIDLEN